VQELVSSRSDGSKGGVPVDRSTVERLARLSHLPVSPVEVDAVRHEIESLLHFVAVVQVRHMHSLVKRTLARLHVLPSCAVSGFILSLI
jgi:hypothetical protein